MEYNPDKIRNIAIIAHVDHGKTTLVDEMLKQAGTFRDNESVQDRMMDSMDLERERGITISAKNTALFYKDYKINIVDTPGHADFGGEVERILGMVDGACLLVDAAEGPLPQTRYVLQKALEKDLAVTVLINKIDRKDARADEVLNEIFDLFVDLGANDKQCDFPVLYCIGKDGIAQTELDKPSDNLEALFELIVHKIPPPTVSDDKTFKLMVSNLSHSDYLGKLVLGRIQSGTLSKNLAIGLIQTETKNLEGMKKYRAQNFFTYNGLKQIPAESLNAGDIGLIAGVEEAFIGDTIISLPERSEAQGWDPQKAALPRISVDDPTLEVEWLVNTSPFAGLEGKNVTSRKIRERLEKESHTNVAIRFRDTDEADRFIVGARGELQISILAETMRREGFEFALGQPQIIYKEENGVKLEPIENAILDIPAESQGSITQMFQQRKGILNNVEQRSGNRIRLEIMIPSRGLIGLRSSFLTETRGEGLLNLMSAGYEAFKGEIKHRTTGALVADRKGTSNAYSLETLQKRGTLFISGAVDVYEGMVIGENAKANDLNVNPNKAKQLTNFRTSNTDDAITLTPPRIVTIENGLEWINADELLEVTPKNVRVRKRHLSVHDR